MLVTWWVLACLLAATMLTPASCGFSCESMTSHSCSCSSHTPTVFELLCPDQMAVTINLQESIQFQCNSATFSFSEPEGLHVGDVSRFLLRLCPLPDKPIREVMKNIGINKIEMLQIQSYNLLNDTLIKKHFERLDDVTNLSLNNNGLTSLPRDIFESMGSLTWLDMKFNNVADYPRDIFYFTPKLEVLELGKNNLSRLVPGIFKNLDRLRLLNLWGNNLRNLTRVVFSDVPNLESLDLSTNNMDYIRSDLFADLMKLKKLNLYSNAFTSLPQGLLSRNFDLEEFQMHENMKVISSLPPGFFANLEKLKVIKLGGSQIKHLPNDTFSGSSKIEKIYLNRNFIGTVERNAFSGLDALEFLDLSQNHISHLPEDLFDSTKKLKTLLLNSNELTKIPPNLFLQLTKVEYIDLRFNKIKEIKGPQFLNLDSLKTLNISNNQLTSLEGETPIRDGWVNSYSVLKRCNSLQDLQLANNSLQEIYGDWTLLLNKLHTLNLSHNRFTNISTDDLGFLSAANLLVDLSNNNITLVDFSRVQLTAESYVSNFNTPYERDQKTKTRHIMFDNNPFNCNCQMLSFVQFIRGELSPEVQYLFNIPGANLKCHSPVALENLPLIRVHPTLLTCQFPNNSHSYTCPNGCMCSFRPIDKANIIDCQGFGLTRLPSYISTINFTNHSELYFQGNRLQTFELPFNKGYENVTHFHLSNNNLTNFNVSAVSHKLKVLDLSNNSLRKLHDNAVMFLNAAYNLSSLELRGNPWQCDCETKPLISLVKKRFKQVLHPENITCSDGKQQLQNLDESDLCFDYLLLLCIILAVVGFLIAILTGLYFRYYTAIHIYCFSSKWKFLRWLVSRPDHDNEKIYDAFISFSHDDEEFVSEILVPELEQNGHRKYKLCLHYRDWTPGEMITTQVIESVQRSRRTIVVLSPGFIESVWGAMEFKTAHAEALRDGKSRVVVILYKDIGPIKNLDEELKTYLQLNTYVKWGSPWFWQQLHYSLPHTIEDAADLGCVLGCYPRVKRGSRSQIVRNMHLNERQLSLHNLSENSEKVSEKVNTSSSLLIIDKLDKKEEKAKQDASKNNSKVNGAICV